jgi:hypothetical protein
MGPAKHVALDLLTRAAARKLDAPWGCISVLDEAGRLRASSYGLPIPSALLISWPFAKQVTTTARPWVVDDGGGV